MGDTSLRKIAFKLIAFVIFRQSYVKKRERPNFAASFFHIPQKDLIEQAFLTKDSRQRLGCRESLIRLSDIILSPCAIYDVGNDMVYNIIEIRLAQEAVAMCEHIINIERIYNMCYEKRLLWQWH